LFCTIFIGAKISVSKKPWRGTDFLGIDLFESTASFNLGLKTRMVIIGELIYLEYRIAYECIFFAIF
jgi:hypothetical protein